MRVECSHDRVDQLTVRPAQYEKNRSKFQEQKAALSSAIRNLVILSWMRARISESVDEAAA